MDSVVIRGQNRSTSSLMRQISAVIERSRWATRPQRELRRLRRVVARLASLVSTWVTSPFSSGDLLAETAGALLRCYFPSGDQIEDQRLHQVSDRRLAHRGTARGVGHLADVGLGEVLHGVRGMLLAWPRRRMPLPRSKASPSRTPLPPRRGCRRSVARPRSAMPAAAHWTRAATVTAVGTAQQCPFIQLPAAIHPRFP